MTGRKAIIIFSSWKLLSLSLECTWSYKTWNFHIKAIFVSDIFICILSFSATIYTNGDTHWRRVESVWCCLFIWKGPVMFWIVLLGIAATTFIFMVLLYCIIDMFIRFFAGSKTNTLLKMNLFWYWRCSIYHKFKSRSMVFLILW